MCGIAGIILSPAGTLPDLRERLTRMACAMQHRGPDDGGLYISPDGAVGLANRRLAIRDLSSAGHMPIGNSDRSIWITYNGEIYNTHELRPELERLGCEFSSNSDTEVILRGYEAWGDKIVTRLEGMFAFAIYNYSTGRIFIARDQMGIKPLYYAYTSQAFIFASELKAMLASGLVSREISPAGLTGYLLTASVPNPLTIYQGICALEPASYLNIELDGWRRPEPKQYWSLPVDTVAVRSVEQAVDQVEGLLADSVRIRLVSDVPLGAFLSGGLDSSIIVAFMRQATTSPIRTCSIAFNEPALSESKYARAMAAAVGADHYERVVTAEDVVAEFDRILYAMDQPAPDGFNTYFVSKTAREAGLTVALSGLGGDELFGGYPNTFRDVPRMMTALRLAKIVPGAAWLARGSVQMLERPSWNRVADALDRPPSLASAYLTRRGLFSPSEVKQLVRADVWQTASEQFDMIEQIEASADGQSRHASETFAWISRAELRTYTHHQLLRDTDAMSMIHSLEVRVPFFDTRLVEAVLRLPANVKIGDGSVPKPLLAQIGKPYLPSLISERRDKMGFSFPYDSWLRAGLKEKVNQVLSEVKHSGLLQRDAIDLVSESFQNHKSHWSRLWALVALGQLSLQS